MNKHLLSALTLSLLAGLSQAADDNKANTAAAPQAALNPSQANAAVSGIEVQHVDPSVRAQDDFFRHLNGKWLQNTEIPADRSSWGAFHKLIEDTQPKLLNLIETAARDPNQARGSDAQKIGDFYASFMDEAKVEQLGIQPIHAELARVASLKKHAELPAYIAHASRRGIAAPYDFGIHQDNRDSTKYVADIRAKYQAHVEKMLALAGYKDAKAKAKAIVAFETEIAKLQWTKVELRDPIKQYNKVDIKDLAKMVPGHDVKGFLKTAGVADKASYVIVSQPSYLKGVAGLMKKTPMSTLKSYFQWNTIRSFAPYLSKDFVEENFAFYGATLSGAKEMRPRWKRGVSAVEAGLGEVLGKLYVEQYFPAEYKARMEGLVKNLLVAYKQSIDTLDWMSPETKKQAQAKLAKFNYKIGYPNKWKDYSALDIVRDDLVGNVVRARETAYDREVNKLGKPIDREEWIMTPQMVNAYYNPEMNEIAFPAGILQPPFFDPKADDAVNYGAIGAVIGHEISHGFDDQGSKYDGDGNLRNWWTEEDHKNFSAKADMLVRQYDSYAPLPGYNVNGKLTLGENIADNSGLAIAYKAYKLSLGGKPAPVIDGLTGEQRFYAGFGQVWRSKMREAAQIQQVKTDPHSPGEFRANGSMRNQPGFYEAFGVKEGDKMYLAPKDRVIIW